MRSCCPPRMAINDPCDGAAAHAEFDGNLPIGQAVLAEIEHLASVFFAPMRVGRMVRRSGFPSTCKRTVNSFPLPADRLALAVEGGWAVCTTAQDPAAIEGVTVQGVRFHKNHHAKATQKAAQPAIMARPAH